MSTSPSSPLKPEPVHFYSTESDFQSLDDHSQLTDVCAFITANSFERHSLYNQHHSRSSYSLAGEWTEDNSGFGINLGTLAGMPVFLSFSFAQIAGVRICFVDPTSMVVDYRIVDQFLALFCDRQEKRMGHRPIISDAMNVHNVYTQLRPLKALTEAFHLRQATCSAQHHTTPSI